MFSSFWNFAFKREILNRIVKPNLEQTFKQSFKFESNF